MNFIYSWLLYIPEMHSSMEYINFFKYVIWVLPEDFLLFIFILNRQ